jgi:hypothetical protein
MLPLFLFVPSFDAATLTDRTNAFQVPNVREPLTLGIRLLGAGLCPADFLASGALLVSLGVFLATWVKRVGRSIVLSVIAFFLLGMIWPTVVEIAVGLAAWLYRRGPTDWMENHRWVSQTIGALSPIAGPILPLNALRWNYGGGTSFWIGVHAVIVFKVAVACLLLEAAVLTFDHCLGRVSEAPHRAGLTPPLPTP